MTIAQYWEVFSEIQQIINIAMILTVVELFIIPLGLLIWAITKIKHVIPISIILFYIVGFFTLSVWLTSSHKLNELSKEWEQTNEYSSYSGTNESITQHMNEPY